MKALQRYVFAFLVHLKPAPKVDAVSSRLPILLLKFVSL